MGVNWTDFSSKGLKAHRNAVKEIIHKWACCSLVWCEKCLLSAKYNILVRTVSWKHQTGLHGILETGQMQSWMGFVLKWLQPVNSMILTLLLLFFLFSYIAGQGNFVYVYSAVQREGDIAIFTTKTPFPASIGVCHLRFWYYMYGSARMGTLKVRA